MKQSIKLLAFSFFALVMFAVSGTANAAFNTNVGGQDCVPAVGIAQNGQNIQSGCAAYQSQAYGTVGQSFDVRLYYRNTGTTDATGVTLGMTGSSAAGSFNAFLNSSAGSVSGTAYLTYPANSKIQFNGAKVYQRQGTNTPVVIKEITNIQDLASFSIPTIPSYTKCPQSNAFCYQGIFVATFTIVPDNVQPQKCTDPNAQNYGGALPCTYYQPPQTCTDPNAMNYGGPLPCIPRQPQQQCYINYFNANPTQINVGGSSMLNWSTTGCTSAQIYPNVGGVNLNGSQYVSPGSSTVYTLNAYGANSTSATTIVTVGQVTRPICSDGIDNDGDGKVDSNDPGCFVGNVYDASRMSEYNVDAPVNQAPSASTLAATGVTSGVCKFNGIARINTAGQTNGYFKYGTSASNLIYTTPQDSVGYNTGSYQFSDNVSGLVPSTTYYYKLVVTNGFGTREGETRSCTTKSNNVVVTTQAPSTTRTVVRPIVTTVAPAERIIANSAPSLLFLRIDDRREDLTCSDVVDYQVVYKNVSNITLEKAVLEVQLPAGVNYVKSSGGGTYSETTKTVTFEIGTVLPNQEDAKFIQADVNCAEVDSDMLVANASMSYTNPTTTAQEEAVAYDLDKFFNSGENGRTSLTGAAIFGGSFLPNSLVGWLVLILVILGVAYFIRLFLMPVAPKERDQAMHDDHHDMHAAH